VAAALFLYRLGLLVLRDERVARRAAYLFCIVPSSIFMSAVYSER
jgi:phosphatidylinositol glycan class V